MTLSTDVLEKRWSNLLEAIKEPKFAGFSASGYFHQEAYKYAIYERAREELGTKWWEPQDVGTGKLQKAVSSATITTVREDSKSVPNNLVDWRQTTNFKDRPPSQALETLLYNFFKSKVTDQLAFEGLLLERLPYQFIAYLFFVKDKNRFSPISQQIFDLSFQLLGLDFKTSGMGSWDNYRQYCDYLKHVRDFLKTKDRAATLLDAHSFVFHLGHRAQKGLDGHVLPEADVPQQIEIDSPVSQATSATPKIATPTEPEAGDLVFDPSQVREEDYTPDETRDTRARTLKSIAERRGQSGFRKALLDRYGSRCMVTGCEVLQVVEAAHIAPYRGLEDQDPSNGLLLRADLHTLFDEDLLGFNPAGLIATFAPQVKDREYDQLRGRALHVSPDWVPSERAIEWKWRQFLAKTPK